MQFSFFFLSGSEPKCEDESREEEHSRYGVDGGHAYGTPHANLLYPLEELAEYLCDGITNQHSRIRNNCRMVEIHSG